MVQALALHVTALYLLSGFIKTEQLAHSHEFKYYLDNSLHGKTVEKEAGKSIRDITRKIYIQLIKAFFL